MDTKSSVNNTIQLKKLELISMKFERGNDLTIALSDVKMGFDIKSEDTDSDNFTNTLTVKLTSKKSLDFKLKVAMRATFSIKGEPNVEIEFFKNVNAPSFMYPYIRQQVRNLSLEAGYNAPLILPLFNFVKYYQDRKK